MTDRELMQQALDALINAKGYIFYNVLDDKGNRYDTAIEALRARLAQPEPEPVACDCDSPAWCKQYKKCHRAMLGFEPYVAPPQREWQDYSDADLIEEVRKRGFQIKDAIIQREWQGLTDEEITTIGITHQSLHQVARAIEAKLKAKNGY